jgi:hypothetical protein
MIQKKLPKELRTNVRRYLEYVWENKKEIKVDQEEVFAELNDNLKEKITVCMNGMVLQTIPFLENFNLEFIGELTFHTKHQTFSTDENIFIVIIIILSYINIRRMKKVISCSTSSREEWLSYTGRH